MVERSDGRTVTSNLWSVTVHSLETIQLVRSFLTSHLQLRIEPVSRIDSSGEGFVTCFNRESVGIQSSYEV